MPVTLTPSFLAVALNAAARSQVSRTALIPCSVKCMVVMKVAIAAFPPRRDGCHQGILSRLPDNGVRCQSPGVGPDTTHRLRGRAGSGQGAGKPHRGSDYNGPGRVPGPPAGRPAGHAEGPGRRRSMKISLIALAVLFVIYRIAVPGACWL